MGNMSDAETSKNTKLSKADWHATAETLSEALPYILRYAGKTVLIKYGGHAMGDDSLAAGFARDLVLIKRVGVNPIVVHGGGPQIGKMLERLGIVSEFVDGLRVTDQKTVDVVEMVLAGSINKQIVSAINSAGGKAVGLSGKDGNLIQAHKLQRTTRDPESNIERLLDLGFVGEPMQVNPEVLETISASDLIPVVAPIGIGPDGETYNINADTAAGAVAGAIGAKRLLMLTDVPGVMDDAGNVLASLTKAQAKQMIGSGAINGGMIPKVETCIDAVEGGVGGAVILDGRVPHAVLLELFTEHGAGTLIS